MYCRKCGNKLEDDALFCPECGTKVDRESIVSFRIYYNKGNQRTLKNP